MCDEGFGPALVIGNGKGRVSIRRTLNIQKHQELAPLRGEEVSSECLNQVIYIVRGVRAALRAASRNVRRLPGNRQQLNVAFSQSVVFIYVVVFDGAARSRTGEIPAPKQRRLPKNASGEFNHALASG